MSEKNESKVPVTAGPECSAGLGDKVSCKQCGYPHPAHGIGDGEIAAILRERDDWKRTAIMNGKRLENIRQLTTTKHETLEQFVSRVRSALYLKVDA